MESKHTPGPWAIEHPCGFPYTGTYIVSHKGNDAKNFHHFIAEVRQLRDHDETEANTELLVRACEIPGLKSQLAALTKQRDELLEAAEKAEMWLGCRSDDDDRELAIYKILCTAIANAKGGQ